MIPRSPLLSAGPPWRQSQTRRSSEPARGEAHAHGPVELLLDQRAPRVLRGAEDLEVLHRPADLVAGKERLATEPLAGTSMLDLVLEVRLATLALVRHARPQEVVGRHAVAVPLVLGHRVRILAQAHGLIQLPVDCALLLEGGQGPRRGGHRRAEAACRRGKALHPAHLVEVLGVQLHLLADGLAQNLAAVRVHGCRGGTRRGALAPCDAGGGARRTET
mmetsp:Transcript_75206/g.201944  ORF Transcript_75206/g.201944 Transcript_75206/m.201944 type:complete len:219 (+) Transcript_75206:3-659(+)